MTAKAYRRRRNRSRNPARVVTLVMLVCLAGIGGLLFWASHDAESSFAAQIRQLIGLPLLKETPAPPPPEPVVAVPEPEPEPEPPKPEPEPEPEPEPGPPPVTALTWSEFATASRLWPDSLEITRSQEIPIVFKGENFGQMNFVRGQTIAVATVQEDGTLAGTVNGMNLVMPAEATTLYRWFEENHGARYQLELPAHSADPVSPPDAPISPGLRTEILRSLREWALQAFASSEIELTDNAILFRWAPPNSRTHTDFRAEARSVARAYLRIQHRLGGADNFAVCNIIHPETQETLGSGSFFMPTLLPNQ